MGWLSIIARQDSKVAMVEIDDGLRVQYWSSYQDAKEEYERVYTSIGYHAVSGKEVTRPYYTRDVRVSIIPYNRLINYAFI